MVTFVPNGANWLEIIRNILVVENGQKFQNGSKMSKMLQFGSK